MTHENCCAWERRPDQWLKYESLIREGRKNRAFSFPLSQSLAQTLVSYQQSPGGKENHAFPLPWSKSSA